MALHPRINNPMGSSHHHMAGRGALNDTAQAALQLTNYRNFLSRQNSMNSNPNSLHQEASSSFHNSNQSPSSNFQGPATILPGSLQTIPVSGLLTPRLQAQQLQHTVSGSNLIQKNHLQPSQGNQVLQQQMMQQLYNEMCNNNTRAQHSHQSLSGQNGNASARRNGTGFGSNNTAPATSNVSGNGVASAPSRNNSFKGASNSDSSIAGGNTGFNQRAPDLPRTLHMQDDIVSDIAQEFLDNGFFNSELDDYGWKG